MCVHRIIVNGLGFISVAILCSGCTSYSSQSTIKKHVELEDKEDIFNLTYEAHSPWKGSRFAQDACAATLKRIPCTQDTSSNLTALHHPKLELEVSEISAGGVCLQDYLTGLSLGLIPSWCARPNILKFNFVLSKERGFCRRKPYSISSTYFSRLLPLDCSVLKINH